MTPSLWGKARNGLRSVLLLIAIILFSACHGGELSQWQTFVNEGGLVTPVATDGAVSGPAEVADVADAAVDTDVADTDAENTDVAGAEVADEEIAPDSANADADTAVAPVAEAGDETPDGPPETEASPSTFVPLLTTDTRQPTGPPPLDLRTTENVLILGTDTRIGEVVWRTDTIMVLGLDYQYRRAALLSIPRDLLVEIPDVGWRRINQVDYIGDRVLEVEGGGPALFSQVLSNTLGIQTEHWVRADMEGFREFVDLLDGVEVHLDCPYYELYQDDNTKEFFWYTLPAGDVVMDGEMAFMFVRLRYLNSDSGRSMRQRQFLWALRDQAMSTNLLPKIPGLWRLMRDNFETDLTLLEMLELGNFGLSLDSSSVRASAITVKDLERYITPSGADVLRISDPERIQAIIDNIWDAPPLAAAGGADPGQCPPAPSAVPDYLILEAPTPTPEEIAAGEEISPTADVTEPDPEAKTAAESTPEPVAEQAVTGLVEEAEVAAVETLVATTPTTDTVVAVIPVVIPTAIPAIPLESGMKVEVTNTEGRSIRLRSLPGLTSEVLDAYLTGEVLEILVPGDDYVRYPVDVDGYRWVRVVAWDGSIGWIAQRYLRLVNEIVDPGAGDATSALPGDASP